jgi:hypothetical protein
VRQEEIALLYGKEVVRLKRGASFGELGAQEKKDIARRRDSLEDEAGDEVKRSLFNPNSISRSH